MAINLVRCPVLGGNVTRISDLEGATTKIICAEYERSTGTCRMKRTATQGGMLSQLLERMSENTLDSKNTRCVLG
jgi:hypothetical protein